MQQIESVKKPIYMRLARSEGVLHNKHNMLRLGKALEISEGTEITIISIGVMTKRAIEVANMLNGEKSNVAGVVEIHTFKPFDRDGIIKSSKGKRLVVTIEDNTGSLEEKVRSVLVNATAKIISFKIPDDFTHISGSSEYLFESFGMGTQQIYEKIKVEM